MTSIFRIYKVIRIKCGYRWAFCRLILTLTNILSEHESTQPQFEYCSNTFIMRRLGRPKLFEPGPAPAVGQIV